MTVPNALAIHADAEGIERVSKGLTVNDINLRE